LATSPELHSKLLVVGIPLPRVPDPGRRRRVRSRQAVRGPRAAEPVGAGWGQRGDRLPPAPCCTLFDMMCIM